MEIPVYLFIGFLEGGKTHMIQESMEDQRFNSGEKTMIKVQQIPLEPQQHVMEEVFEVRFDFNKAVIKPEYQDLIRQLASATQENKNITGVHLHAGFLCK